MKKSYADEFKYRDYLISSLSNRLEEARDNFIPELAEIAPVLSSQLEKNLTELAKRFEPTTKALSGRLKELLEMTMAFALQAPDVLIKKFELPLSKETLWLFQTRASMLASEDILFVLVYLTYTESVSQKNINYFCARVLPASHLDRAHTKTDYPRIAEGLLQNAFRQKELKEHPAAWLMRTVKFLNENRQRDYPLDKMDSKLLLSLFFTE